MSCDDSYSLPSEPDNTFLSYYLVRRLFQELGNIYKNLTRCMCTGYIAHPLAKEDSLISSSSDGPCKDSLLNVSPAYSVDKPVLGSAI
jgi:hypothetical protein